MREDRAVVMQAAASVGFHTVRFAAIQPTPTFMAYASWLDQGHHGTMSYLERGREVRADARRRLPEIRSVAVFALEHHHQRPPDPGGRTGQVARYAWGRDYHNLIGKRLRKLRRALRVADIDSWGGVDTAPILERAWAQAAGLGFSGKNCMQILPGQTSYFFLAVLFLTADVPPDPPTAQDHCGRCRRCLDACPTKAFVQPHILDSTKCISYWTIECRDLPPPALRPAFGRWVFGCDVCQEVCPHNHHPTVSQEDDFLPRNAWLDLDEIVQTPDADLKERFTGTPLRRPGGEGLKRNALIVLGNIGDPGGIPSARLGLLHDSPVVRGAAVWCLDQLGDPDVHRHRDDHAIVQRELSLLTPRR